MDEDKNTNNPGSYVHDKRLKREYGKPFDLDHLPESMSLESLFKDQQEWKTDNEDMVELLHKALGSLSPQTRQVIHMVYFEKMTHKEVAESIPMDIRDVNKVTQRAIKRLKKYFLSGA